MKSLRSIPLLGPLALLAASPAYASGGLVCRTAGPNPVEVSLVIGHTIVPAVAGARLTVGGRGVPVAVAQSWLDAKEVRLELVDPNVMRRELSLRAAKVGAFYDGSVLRGGRKSWIRCREG